MRLHEIKAFKNNRIRVDGLSNSLHSDTFNQLKWLFVLVVSTSFCCYLLVHSSVDYAKFQVATIYRIQSELKAIFPRITLCSVNPMNSDYFVQLVKNANMSELDSEPYQNYVKIEYYHKQTTGHYFTTEEQRSLFDFDGFVISCKFQNKPCKTDSFRQIFHPYNLNCIQFNSGFNNNGDTVELLTAKEGGTFNELSMEFYVGIPNYLTQLIAGRGINLFIANTSEDPFKNTPSPIMLTPGIGTRINVVKNVYSQYNSWPYLYSSCNVNERDELNEPIKDESMFKRVLANNYTYAQDSCLLLCFQTYMRKQCNCCSIWIGYLLDGCDYCFLGPKRCAYDYYYDVFNVGDLIVDNCLDKTSTTTNLSSNIQISCIWKTLYKRTRCF